MNIFVLDLTPSLAAEYQCDRHVVKMLLESCQLFSSVKNKLGYSTTYKPTHGNHPCTLWAGQSKQNYLWLLDHSRALYQEYTKRYYKIHKCQALVDGELSDIPNGLSDTGLTTFAQAMPDQYRVPNDPVTAYRNYYLGEKAGFAKWKLGNVPEWWTNKALVGCV